MFFYRTSNQNEIDLIVDYRNSAEVIEVKNSKTFNPRMIKTIELFVADGGKGYLLYQGIELPYSDQIRIMPYQKYLGQG